MMKSNKRVGVRQYKKSAAARLQWTPELHHHFVNAVDRLGGRYKATPKRIVQVMGVKGLKISHVKSHLQMYRNMPAENCNSSEYMPHFSPLVPQGHAFDERLLRSYFSDNNNERIDSNPIGHPQIYQESEGSLNYEMRKEEKDEEEDDDMQQLQSTKDDEINLDLSISCSFYS